MNLFGIDIVTDDSLLPTAAKFVHPSGKEQVFIGGKEVIEQPQPNHPAPDGRTGVEGGHHE